MSGDFPNEMGRVKSVRLFPGMGKWTLKNAHILTHVHSFQSSAVSGQLFSYAN